MGNKRGTVPTSRGKRGHNGSTARRTGGPAAAMAAAQEGAFRAILTSARTELVSVDDALDAESWASQLRSMWHRMSLVDGADPEEVFGGALVDWLAGQHQPAALAALRALGGVGSEWFAGRAARAADRLARAGVSEPAWAGEVGQATPTEAWRLSEDYYGDGYAIFVGFTRPGATAHTVNVYIDRNLGGIAKDAFVAAEPLDDVLDAVRRTLADEDVDLEQQDLADAAAEIRAAFGCTDRTLGPPGSDTLLAVRGLIEARLRLLPPNGQVAEWPSLTDPERDALLDEFCASPEAAGLSGCPDLAAVAHDILSFTCDYLDGRPLRWSPTVVEVFLADWFPRKISAGRDYFAQVPQVTKSWIRFAGRIRHIDGRHVAETLTAVDRWTPELLGGADDPATWGPAKAFVMAAQQAGVDITDQRAVDEYMEVYNDQLASGPAAGARAATLRNRVRLGH